MKSPSKGAVLAIISWIALPLLFAMVFIPFRIASQSSLETWASYAGKLQARVWFQEGHHRLLVLTPNSKSEFTGRKDGQYEVWSWGHYTNTSWLTVGDPDRQFINAFNERMRQLCEEKPKAD